MAHQHNIGYAVP